MNLSIAKPILAVALPLLVVGCTNMGSSPRGNLLSAQNPSTIGSPGDARGKDAILPAEGPRGPLAGLENSFIFHPTRFPDGNWNPRGSNWDRGALAVEDAWFTSADGTKLHGWYYPHQQARAVVLYCHGNRGNLSYCADLVRYLHDNHKLSVMVFDYRGFGRSEGTPDVRGILQDARAARAWLAQRAAIAEKDIVLMGRSLGGAVAIDLAAADGARGLILESTFTSLRDVTRMKLPLVGPLMQNQLNSLARISSYKGPLLQSHGDADSIIPYQNGSRLFAAANEPKQFVTIFGGDHHSPQSVEYYQALDRFVDGLPPVGRGARVDGCRREPSGQITPGPCARSR